MTQRYHDHHCSSCSATSHEVDSCHKMFGNSNVFRYFFILKVSVKFQQVFRCPFPIAIPREAVTCEQFIVQLNLISSQ